MATLIGTPPNAIAAGLLDDVRAVSFLTWMLFGLPPALLVAGGLAAALALHSAVRGAEFSLPPPASETADASSAMCLPISTPPNGIVHATGAIGSRDFLRGGLAVAWLVPPVAVGWCFAVAGWLWA